LPLFPCVINFGMWMRADEVIDMRLRQILFTCRWLLAPLYVGLGVGLAAVVFKAAEKILALVLNVAGLSEASTIVAVLGLVDLTLVGSLILLVIISAMKISSLRSTKRTGAAGPNGWASSSSMALH
jgi:uncharacterized protein (TIGR00645 family)